MVRRHGAFLTIVFLAYLQARPALATDIANQEQRDFAILIDGKEAGQSRLTITQQADGTTVVQAAAKVELKQLLFNYAYNVESTEWWKGGKLTAVKAATVENSKRTEVTGAAGGGRFRLVVNGLERAASTDAWTASFWKLADARYHNKSVPVLEPDSGKEYTAQLQYIGTEQLTLQRQPQSCYHFRVTGGPYPVDVWFDRYHRLVRQEFTDSGHKTIVQLVAVKR